MAVTEEQYLTQVYWRFEGKYCVPLQVTRVSRTTNKQDESRAKRRASAMSVRFYQTIRSEVPERSDELDESVARCDNGLSSNR